MRPSRLAAASYCLGLTLAAAAGAADPSEAASKPPSEATKQSLAKADPQMKAVLDALQAMDPKPIEALSPKDARKQPTPGMAAMQVMKDRGMSTKPEKLGGVDDREIDRPGNQGGDLGYRVYEPEGDAPAGGFPVLVYFHGGGWVIGSLDAYDASARALAKQAGAVVVSVDYRLAPEHKFPAAHEDAYFATQWVMDNAAELKGDPARVAVGGESAGGNLATAVCMMAAERGGKMPVHQLIVYPIADYNTDSESYQEHAQAKPLNKAMMAWFFDHYLTGPEDGATTLISPLRASDDALRTLPPATVITAEIDPLRSEGEAYAEKLKAAGVDVEHRHYPGVTHEFFGMAKVVDKAAEAQAFAVQRLEQSFNQSAAAAR